MLVHCVRRLLPLLLAAGLALSLAACSGAPDDRPRPPTPTTTPTGSSVPVTGPLIVFSEYLESERQGDEPGPNRRVYVYDVSTGGYWIALDYHHTSPPCGMATTAASR